jgi:polyisoprenoid-binding protein YceI
MKIRTLALSLLALGGLVTVATVTTTRATAQAPASQDGSGDWYQIDPVHSTVIFGIEHAGIGYFYGRINGPVGEYHFDADDPGACSFEVKAKVKNIDTANKSRDGHLKGPDFFNGREFPEIAFRSTSVERAGKDSYKVTGELSMHGVSKPITVEMRFVGAGEFRGSNRTGFQTTFTVNRMDYGVDYMPGGLGNEVTLMIGFEGVRK